MSKERLEEIDKFKSFIDSLDDSADADDFHKFIDTCQINYEEGTFNEILRFMKSQAERVQELERENRALKAVASSNKFIGEQYLQQNNQYRESINLALNHIHTGNFTLATVELNKALLKEVEQ